MGHRRSALGAAGEGIARRHLERLGYVFVEGNWHCAEGEIDLVMRHREELVFVEVKTRRSETAGAAEESVSRAKGQRLLKAGLRYLAAHPEAGDPIWRVDVVAVSLSASGAVQRLTHFENAVISG